MDWLHLVLESAAGYLTVTTVISRFVYRRMDFENKIRPVHDGWVATYEKGPHALKAWLVSLTWGLWAAFGPPVIAGAVVGGSIGWAVKQLGRGVAWYIKSPDLLRPAKALKPQRVTTATETARAEAELSQVNAELAALQKPAAALVTLPAADAYGDGWHRQLNSDGSVLWVPRGTDS